MTLIFGILSFLGGLLFLMALAGAGFQRRGDGADGEVPAPGVGQAAQPAVCDDPAADEGAGPRGRGQPAQPRRPGLPGPGCRSCWGPTARTIPPSPPPAG
ncbi:MAG: hypothetical protein WDN45_06300 [Caulobacteraceae bacterium]